MKSIVETAVSEAKAYEKAGFHAVMIENMHDRPYPARTADPATTAAMTVIGQEVRKSVRIPLGIQILTGANREALAVAHAVGASFMRAEAFVYAHIAHSGFIDACAADLVRYRRSIGAEDVKIIADIKKKHAAHAITQDVDIVQEATAAERFLADGVIVSGKETASPADPEKVKRVSEAVNIPVWIGSGITSRNLSEYLPHADAMIVGSSLKEGGLWSNPLRPAALQELVSTFNKLLA